MPVLSIGDTAIPYEIRRSPRAKRIRLSVRPGQVVVTAPALIRTRRIIDFVESKRQWLLAKTEALRERELAAVPHRFVSGAKVLFRGRFLRLRVSESDVTEPLLHYASAFRVSLPRGMSGARAEAATRELVLSWLRGRAIADARTWARRYAPKIGARPSRITLRDQKTLWGSCSSRGAISLNWRLVAAPRAVFEYVVVHELCHLRHGNHGKRFWQLVAEVMPDYSERKQWLRRQGVALG